MAKKYEIENYYLIDSENLKEYGLSRIEKLTEKDRVRIFYRETDQSNPEYLSMELHRKIYESPARFEYQKVNLRRKQAVDIIIENYVDECLESKSVKNYYIVSDDHGYDDQIKEFCARGYSVSRIGRNEPVRQKAQQAPKKSAKEKKREDKIRTFFGQNFTDKKYKDKKEEILTAIAASKDRGELNNRLQITFDSSEVKVILKTLKPLTNELYKKDKND